jgi:uncharacterized protein (TIGR02118 family)
VIKVSVMYPHRDGARFDFEYYLATHTPLVLERLGAACKRCTVDKGRAQMRPAAPPLYVAICHLEFESLEAFQAAFAPHAAEITADAANYTDISPVSQLSETSVIVDAAQSGRRE